MSIEKGVPQGSVLGPLLYLSYVRDFVCKISVTYADDASFVVSTSTNKQNVVFALVYTTFKKIKRYFDENELPMNIKKTTLVNFNMSKKQTVSHFVKINTDSIVQSNSTKFLEVTLEFIT